MKKNVVIITLLSVIIVILIVVIVCLCTRENVYVNKDCVTKDNAESVPVKKDFNICEIDMNGKTSVNSYKLCDEDFFLKDYRRVVLKNVDINNKKWEIVYEFNGIAEEPGNRITAVYRDGYLFDIHIGEYANVLKSVEIKDNLLLLTESSFTDVPESTNKYDIAGLYSEQNRADIIEIDY